MNVGGSMRSKIVRSVVNFLFILGLMIGAVRAKGGRSCCGGTDAEDMCIIYKVINSRYYSPLEFDTLKTRFCYRLVKKQVDSFDYVKIYFFGVPYGQWPYQAFGSDDTLRIDKVNYSYDEKWDTLIFTGFANPDSYEIYVRIEGWQNGRQVGPTVLAQKSGDTLTKVEGPGGRQLVLFMGNRRICNCGDTLKDPYAYPLMVQVVDANGNGINGDTIWFEADYGKFGNQSLMGFITATVNYGDSTLNGIAAPSGDFPYIFPSEPHDIVISIEAWKDTIWATKQVALKCFADSELSGLTPPKCHETTDDSNKNVEIPGDGYNDGTGKKTIKVEIDYASNIISSDLIEWAVDDMKKILATAKLDTSDANFVVDDGISVPDTIYPSQLKLYLAQHRTHKDWRDAYIHVIIGSREPQDSYPGEVVAYNLTSWGHFSHTKCAHLASTDSSIAQAFLDSTGIIIYARHIYEAMQDTHDYSWDWCKGVAHAMAHEIGHSLGLLSHHPNGVMNSIVDYTVPYDSFNYFLDTLLNRDPPEDAMNTRDVLGIHTIDVGW
jgi:hypothetical protein